MSDGFTLAQLKELYPNISDDVLKRNCNLPPQASNCPTTGVKVTSQGREAPEHQPDAVKGTGKRRKYLNTPTFYNGREYQSKREAERAEVNDFRVKAGELIAWFPQVHFTLAGGIQYIADFVELKPDFTFDVVDVKPVDWETGKKKLMQGFRDKRKLFREKFPGKDILIK